MAKTPKVKQESATKAVTEEAPVAVVKQEEAPQASLTRVRNVSRNRLRQFSTGMIIAAGEEKDMIHESWLESQIEAGLLKKV